MEEINWKWLIGTGFVLSLGTGGGWSIAEELFGRGSGNYFLGLGICICTASMVIKTFLYAKARRFLYFRLLFMGCMGFDLSWFMSCLFFPLFFVAAIDFSIKVAAIFFYVFLCLSNVILAVKDFNARWFYVDDKKFKKAFKGGFNYRRWRELLNSMGLAVIFFIPGIPRRFHEHIGLFSAASFLIGGLIWPAHPVIRIAVIGIPVSLFAAGLFQMSAYCFAEARRVALIEKNKNIMIETTSLKRRRRN
jgi:hypothetical protein